MRMLTLLSCIVASTLGLNAQAHDREIRPKVQLALLLDTSNSMDGLIAQAKSQLWKCVNEFATAEKDGRKPVLEVALYEYGKSSLSERDGFVRRIAKLTTDLDTISERLFELKTNGGSEYCGWVIRDAAEDLDWSDRKGDYKVMFIAGNEPFSQGSVDYRDACKEAHRKGIVVNTIFCGDDGDRAASSWRQGAVLAKGESLIIDQNAKVAHIAAPQDEEIARIGVELNLTYVAYGKKGRLAQERQSVQDTNAREMKQGAAVQRAVCKSSVHYRNSDWDLVDAVNTGEKDLGDVKDADLPEAMRGMDEAERGAYIKKQAKRRAELQARVAELNTERKVYVAAQMKQQAAEGDDTLDGAVLSVVREQAEAMKFVF